MVTGTKEGVLQFRQYIDTPQVVHNRKSCHVGTLILIKLFTTESLAIKLFTNQSPGILMIPIKFVHNKKVWNLEDSHHQVVSQQLCVMYMQHVNYGDKQQNH